MSTLYHGTSETIAKAIIDEDCLRPAGTMPTANPAHVYLIDTFHHAIMFGYSRVMGRWIGGKFTLSSFVEGRMYDDVAIFLVDKGSLNKHLFRADDFFKGETAYEGIVSGDALTQMVCIPVTKKLETFLGSIQNPTRLARYIGVDLVKHLDAKTFELVESTS